MAHSVVYVGVNSQPYFEHHGRLGMKWGKRNGPPYPLDYSKLSAEEREKDKTRVKEEGDIESVGYKKNRSYFSDQEINEVIQRYQLNTRINQLSAESAKMKAGKSKTEELAENMQKVADVGFKLSNAIQAGSNVYNNVAKVMNAFGDADMPIIGQQKTKEKIAFKGDIQSVLKNIDNYSDNQLADIAKRVENINKIGSKVTLDNFRKGQVEQQKPSKAETKAEKQLAKQEAKQEAKLSKQEAHNKAVEEFRAKDAIIQQQRAQQKAEAEKNKPSAEQQYLDKMDRKYELSKTQQLKDEYTKASKERNEAESNFRRGGYTDLDYKKAQVADARFNIAERAMAQQQAKNTYKKPEDYSTEDKMKHPFAYSKAIERNKAEKAFREADDRRKLAQLEKEVAAEEKAEQERRKKQGQAWAYEWLDAAL